LSIALYIASSAKDVTVRALVREENGDIVESDLPTQLASKYRMNVYGSLFFAGPRTLAGAPPSPTGATRPAVALRLRGRTRVGATLIEVLDTYADRLADAGGRLYLSGVNADVSAQPRRTGKLDIDRTVHIVPAELTLGASTRDAVESASAWLAAYVLPRNLRQRVGPDKGLRLCECVHPRLRLTGRGAVKRS
jgi:sulfate permease, SulP family